MADTVAEAVQQAAENITENANVKIPATPEGMFLAYSSLVIMALLPIFFGSKRSVSHQKEQKVSRKLHSTSCNDFNVPLAIAGIIGEARHHD
jgi:hypothetical protein